MAKVVWHKVDTRLTGLKTVEVDAAEVLKTDWDKQTGIAVIDKEDVEIPVDMGRFFSPLGRYGQTLMNVDAREELRDSLAVYWSHEGKPKIFADALCSETESIYLRSKFVKAKTVDRMIDVNRVISDVNESVEYDRVVIGSDENTLEVQFLSSASRVEVKAGDFVDAGLFVTFNGRVRVAAGINRLICTNGMIRRLDVWKGTDFKFGADFIKRGVELANWLILQQDRRVTNIRELSVVLRDYPGRIQRVFFKSWAEKCDLGELTWADVLNDVTSVANRSLGSFRYKMLATPSAMAVLDEEICRCPTCSASVGAHN